MSHRLTPFVQNRRFWLPIVHPRTAADFVPWPTAPQCPLTPGYCHRGPDRGFMEGRPVDISLGVRCSTQSELLHAAQHEFKIGGAIRRTCLAIDGPRVPAQDIYPLSTGPFIVLSALVILRLWTHHSHQAVVPEGTAARSCRAPYPINPPAALTGHRGATLRASLASASNTQKSLVSVRTPARCSISITRSGWWQSRSRYNEAALMGGMAVRITKFIPPKECCAWGQ